MEIQGIKAGPSLRNPSLPSGRAPRATGGGGACKDVQQWSVKLWRVVLGSDYRSGDVYVIPDVQPMHYMAPTIWTVHDSPGFQLFKYHIGISDVRDVFNQTKDLYFNPDAIRPEITFQSPGVYEYYWWAKYSVLHGTVDVWKVSGAKINSTADFAPCTSAWADGSYLYVGNGM